MFICHMYAGEVLVMSSMVMLTSEWLDHVVVGWWMLIFSVKSIGREGRNRCESRNYDWVRKRYSPSLVRVDISIHRIVGKREVVDPGRVYNVQRRKRNLGWDPE